MRFLARKLTIFAQKTIDFRLHKKCTMSLVHFFHRSFVSNYNSSHLGTDARRNFRRNQVLVFVSNFLMFSEKSMRSVFRFA